MLECSNILFQIDIMEIAGLFRNNVPLYMFCIIDVSNFFILLNSATNSLIFLKGGFIYLYTCIFCQANNYLIVGYIKLNGMRASALWCSGSEVVDRATRGSRVRFPAGARSFTRSFSLKMHPFQVPTGWTTKLSSERRWSERRRFVTQGGYSDNWDIGNDVINDKLWF